MPKAQTYQCPNCNGVLEFDATIGKLRCQHCRTVFEEGEAEKFIPIGQTPVEAHETEHARTVEDFLERAPWAITADGSVNAIIYSCPSCAAEIAADQSTVSTNCPYCGNTAVVPGQLSDMLKPDYIIPFKLDKDDAIAALKKYYQGKRFLPNNFTNDNQ